MTWGHVSNKRKAFAPCAWCSLDESEHDESSGCVKKDVGRYCIPVARDVPDERLLYHLNASNEMDMVWDPNEMKWAPHDLRYWLAQLWLLGACASGLRALCREVQIDDVRFLKTSLCLDAPLPTPFCWLLRPTSDPVDLRHVREPNELERTSIRHAWSGCVRAVYCYHRCEWLVPPPNTAASCVLSGVCAETGLGLAWFSPAAHPGSSGSVHRHPPTPSVIFALTERTDSMWLRPAQLNPASTYVVVRSPEAPCFRSVPAVEEFAMRFHDSYSHFRIQPCAIQTRFGYAYGEVQSAKDVDRSSHVLVATKWKRDLLGCVAVECKTVHKGQLRYLDPGATGYLTKSYVA